MIVFIVFIIKKHGVFCLNVALKHRHFFGVGGGSKPPAALFSVLYCCKGLLNLRLSNNIAVSLYNSLFWRFLSTSGLTGYDLIKINVNLKCLHTDCKILNVCVCRPIPITYMHRKQFIH